MSSKINDFFTAAIVGEAFVLELKSGNSAQQALPKRRVGVFSFPQGQLLTVGNPIARNLESGVAQRSPNSKGIDESGAAAADLDFDWERSSKKTSCDSHELESKNISSTGVGRMFVLLLLVILAFGGVYLLWM